MQTENNTLTGKRLSKEEILKNHNITDYTLKQGYIEGGFICNILNAMEEYANHKEETTVSDYEDVIADHKRLVRELDVIINGENAAPQASLCDIVSQLKKEYTLTPVSEERKVGEGEYLRSGGMLLVSKPTPLTVDIEALAEKAYPDFSSGNFIDTDFSKCRKSFIEGAKAILSLSKK